MDTHQVELAVRDGDESWCSCVCGWISSKGSEQDAQELFAAHVVERAFNSTSSI